MKIDNKSRKHGKQNIQGKILSRGDFLSAKLGNNPSYVWRSVLEAQDLLRTGVSKRVGNGLSTDIMKDPWLACDIDPYIHTDHDAIKGQMVSCLMSTANEGWDADLVRDIFNERDTGLILFTPIRRSERDIWYRRKERLGHYSVKSAYAALRDCAGMNNIGRTSSISWNNMWNQKVPLKVKHFVWRAVRGCLPTKELLRSKRVDLSSTCPVCNIYDETAFHILVTCPFAAQCWQHFGYNYDVVTNLQVDSWFQNTMQQGMNGMTRKIFMIAWSIWKNRNGVVWQQKGRESKDIVASALQILNNWESAQDKSFDNSFGFIIQSDGDTHWQQPQAGTVKINTDAALFEDSQTYSHAMVARNHEGTLLEAKSSCKTGSIHPELAESIGIREALSWIKTKDWQEVIVESDCLGAIQAIRCSSINFSYLGRVIDECKKLLVELESRNVTLKFVKRSANSVAHYLAKYSSSIADRTWELVDIHSDFLNVLLKDLIH